MAKTTLSIFALGDNKFAIGTIGKLAKYVVKVAGKTITGVRGRRPMLTEGRYERATNVPAEVKQAFKTALA